MNQDKLLIGPHKDFESIKKIDENGTEYWTARELMPLLGYSKWQNFEYIIEKAKQSCQNSNQYVDDQFTDISKLIDMAKGGQRKVNDHKLSRYACYLIAQNGDAEKEPIALAQTYFAMQTRKQELYENLPDDQKRLLIRGEVTDHNKKLFKSAKKSGVRNFGTFNDAGYKGLYKMSLAEIQKKKKLGKDKLLDRAGSTELAANLFRITQTDDQLQKNLDKGDQIGENAASQTHYKIGGKIRQTIKDIGGTLPENLPPAENIKLLKKRISPATSSTPADT